MGGTACPTSFGSIVFYSILWVIISFFVDVKKDLQGVRAFSLHCIVKSFTDFLLYCTVLSCTVLVCPTCLLTYECTKCGYFVLCVRCMHGMLSVALLLLLFKSPCYPRAITITKPVLATL